MSFFTNFKKYDWIILSTVLLLTTIGLLILYSSGIKPSQVSQQLDTSRQIFYVLIGLLLLVLFSRMDYRVLRNYAWPLYFITLGLLVVVKFLVHKDLERRAG